MSPRVSVKNLSRLCLNVIAEMCIRVLSDDETENCDVVGDFLGNTTYEILEELLKSVLNKSDLDASTRFNCLEVLLREDVKKLETHIFPRFYYEKILNVISVKGTRLLHLNLKGVWVADYPTLLCDVLYKLKNLRSLIIPHMANDDVIQAVIHLKNLIVLDISGESSYTTDGIKKLKSDVLRILEIGNYGKLQLCHQEDDSGPKLVAQILENLPNLTQLKVYSFTGSAVLEAYNKNPDKKTKLTYLHDTGTTLQIMFALQNLVPDLTSIYIDTPDLGVIEELSKFKKLNTLKLTKPQGEALMNFLKISGYQLQSLILNNNKHFSLDLSQLCLAAPNLINLELFQMRLIFTNLDTYFMCLQNFEVLYGEMSDSTLRYILSNAPFLKKIVVGCLVTMTDGDIFRLCAESDFISLEELWFSYARSLTATSVALLMGHCPNLKIIGQLGGWDIQEEEVEYLRGVVASTNTDLKLMVSGMYTN